MQVELLLDLVPENVEALARYAELFRSQRFHALACPGVDPGQSSDLKTLDRTMNTILGACASRGLPVPQVPAVEPPAEVQAAMAELIALLQTLAADAGVGGGAVLVEQINRLIDLLSNERARPLRRVK